MNITTESNDMGWMGKVNGRLQYFSGLKIIEKISHDTVRVVDRDGGEWEIFGGRASGAGPKDWWLDRKENDECIECSSLLDALRLIMQF